MKRYCFVSLFILVFGALSYYVLAEHKMTPKGFSFEAFFSLSGKPTKMLDRGLTKVMGVSAAEEQEFGELQAKRLGENYPKQDFRQPYVADILNKLVNQSNPKSFKWTVFIIDGPPNACSIAGGVVCITDSLLKSLETEAQLVAILAHEKGHIDLGHCVDMVRSQLKHLPSISIIKVLWQHHFSKFQEQEADQYAFETLVALGYDPFALAQAFEILLQLEKAKQKSRPGLNEYWRSHPSLALRIENAREKAKRWVKNNPSKSTYVGKESYHLNILTKLVL